ncbi:MAG TPA: peptidoglycan-binding protein LysM [Desulfuromonadales bacterium]|nr:peptidoglycan-binding protein LysM [Desulfuromonadales bacterium]
MSFFLQICVAIGSFLALFCVSDLYAVMDPRFELDPQAISALKSPSKPQQTRGRRTPGTSRKSPKAAVSRRSAGSVNASGNAPEQSLTLESPVPALTGPEALARTQSLWKKIVPSHNEAQKPLSFQTPVFSLILDQERYPVFARMNGGRIILDQDSSIPPLVKSLIEEKDASVRIVAQSPLGSKKLISSLLEAAGFYSVEENFAIEFGADPKLTVRADFKVEKNADSLINQDVIIISNNRTPVPSSLGNFLKKEGFSLYEPFASLPPLVPLESRTIHSVSAKKQAEIVDSILSAFSVIAEKNKHVDVFATANNGISLAVKAERYFERGGQRYVVTTFDGDPVNYTLFRILETTGYKVVILNAADDFRNVSEKMLSRMKVKGAFARHSLLQEDTSGYSLQMSGFNLNDALLPGGDLFLTDRAMNKVVRDILKESGFAITDR